MKQLKVALACALVAGVVAPVAAQSLSFNVGAVSLYKYRGIDQDKRSPKATIPALQGGVDYSFGNGFYVGNWNSTVKTGSAYTEMDLYAGYGGEITKDLTYDLGLTRYVYLGDSSLNANEWYAGLTYGMVTAKYTRGFSNGNQAARLSFTLKYPVTEKVTLIAVAGFRNSVNNSGADDYSIGASYDLGSGLTATATVSGAETSKVGAAGRGRLVVGVSKAF